MAMEIERKFLVKSNEWENDVRTFHRLEQGYLAFPGPNKEPEVRVRLTSRPFRKGEDDEDGQLLTQEYDCAFITVKSKGDLVRSEAEGAIDLDVAKEMMKACRGVVISKTRHIVPYKNAIFEVDVYHGDLEGLITAEVELSHVGQDIPLPPWIGEDITSVSSYKNASLAKNGMPAHRVMPAPTP